MVSSKIIGGLGNQMFQYAIGRNLALKNRTDLYLDIELLLKRDDTINFTFRNFELDIFNVKYRIQSFNKSSKLIRKINNRLLKTEHLHEDSHLYNPHILTKTGNIYLNGYWQCENYFKDIEHTIREDFTFKAPPDELNTAVLQEIKDVNAISIHIRRGDYITNKQALSYHGVCDTDYYNTAINIIKERVPNPVFYIFSDDFPQVNNEFNFGSEFKKIDFNLGEASYNDMRLMSACKHHIIANSSFSWWGAWLNNSTDKIVVAPKRWFKTKETDIVPNQWMKI